MNGIMPSATDELRLKEADYTKEKAIQLQKIEQLEHSLKDCKEREEAQKRMHETMINCLNSSGDPNMTNQALFQLQASEKHSQVQIEELQSQKRRLNEEIQYKDYKEKELRQQIADKDLYVKDVQMQMERIQNDKRQIIGQQEQERKEYQQKVSQIQNEKEAMLQKIELKSQSQNNELSVEIEKLKLEHQREVEKMKADYEQSLKEIKYFHEQEKFNLQHRVERSTNELSSFIHLVKQRDTQELDSSRQETILRKREELEAEISSLHDEVEHIKHHHDVNITEINKAKLAAEQKALKLEKQLEKIKNAPKPVKIDLSQGNEKKQSEQESKAIVNLKEEIDCLVKENERLEENIKKLRKEKFDNQEYTEKIENKLRQMQKDKNCQENESDKFADVKKQLNSEKRKNIELQQMVNKLQDNIDNIKNKQTSDLLGKDQKIIKLTKQLRDTERKIQDIQQVFNSNPIQNTSHIRSISPYAIGQVSNKLSPKAQTQINSSTLICAPMQEGSMNTKQISQMEFTLLKMCQRMADNAVRMECSTCLSMYETSEFYDHINDEHPILKKNQSQAGISNLTQQSVNHGQYNTNKNHNITKRYAEDMRSSSHHHNILQTSPKAQESQRAVPQQIQPQSINRWAQGSRSFTCLLNEIEEEEKVSNNTSQVQHKKSNTNQFSKYGQKSKSPVSKQQQLNKQLKSRNISNKDHNMSTLQLSTMNSGNTLQSVLRSQKEQKKSHNTSTSRIYHPQSVTINTAQRTEIQNLKRDNKKLSSKLQEQESKINDVSRDCSYIKKRVNNDSSSQINGHLTNEIKGLLEKLVTYQGISKDGKLNDQTYGKTTGSGSITTRKHQNLPISTDSLVELRSSASSVYAKKKKTHKKKDHSSNQGKSPLPLSNKLIYSANNTQHNINKENRSLQEKQPSSKNIHMIPRLNLKSTILNNEENTHSLSSDENTKSMIDTERRYHQVKKSDQMCTNSPKRYQNYFEVLQGVTDKLQNQEETQRMRYKQPRYSPSNDSQQSKMTTVRSQNKLHHTNENAVSSRNLNMPTVYNSKPQHYTVTSSQNNLVLYDSQHTEFFKSKNLVQNQKKESNLPNGFRRLDFDKQNISNEDDCDGLINMPSSCPSLDEFEENQHEDNNNGEGIFRSSVDEDPFITGKFCDNTGQGKQFVFKYSANNSKNSTMKMQNLLNQ